MLKANQDDGFAESGDDDSDGDWTSDDDDDDDSDEYDEEAEDMDAVTTRFGDSTKLGDIK